MRAAFAATRALDRHDLLQVVDRIYAAGCAETSWDRAVEELCRAAGLGGCALTAVDPQEPRPILRASHGLSLFTAADATPAPPPRNPLLTVEVLRSAPGTIWQDRQILPPALLATTSFWTGWMQPRGFVSWAGVILGRNGSEVVCLEVYGRPGAASHDACGLELLATLAPHLTRAWRLGQAKRLIPQRSGPSTLARCHDGDMPRLRSASNVASMPAVIRLRAEFGLTKAEARIALYLADGASLPSMAKRFDVKLTTIRSQLQQVFAKTSTSRQAELVALLLSHGYVTPAEPLQESARQT